MAGNLIVNILDGKYDASLDRIEKAIRERRYDRINQLGPGSRIKLNRLIRPQYLAGATGTIRQFNRTRVVVDLDEPHGRFYRNIRCTPTLLEPTDEPLRGQLKTIEEIFRDG